MANILVGNLPTYTGNTTGAYVVMNDSGNTTTYKTLVSNLGSSWVSAGTIQSVGWGATTTAPTIGATLNNNLSYKQLGYKQWQITMSFNNNGNGGAGANAGSGDYLFSLPNGLSFDTTVPWQTTYTSSVMANDTNFGKFLLPSSGGMISDGAGSTSSMFGPILWSSSQFRIMSYIPGSAISCVGSPYFPVTATIGFTLSFQFIST
jgi:hypothetical protein